MKKGKRTYRERLKTKIRRLKKKKPHKKRLNTKENGISIFNKLVQLITRHGLKRRAYKNLKSALSILRKTLKISRSALPLDTQFLHIAVKKINPNFYIRKINLGRKSIYAPAPLHSHKKVSVSLR
jgi:ribosomal protein S7